MATIDWAGSRDKWKGMFVGALKKVQKQAHPSMDLAQDAIDELDSKLYNLMVHLCSQQDEVPMNTAECEQCVKRFFPPESAALSTWAITTANKAVEERLSSGRRRASSVSTEFPVDKAHQRLMKDGSKGKSVKIDQDVTVYLMSVLDYVAADILTLVGEYVMRVGSTTVITSRDVQTAVMGDKALDALLKPLASLPKVQAGTGMGQGPDLAYEDAMKEMMQTEVKYQGSLDMLVKVFLDIFESSGKIPDHATAAIFGNIKAIVELSQGLTSLLEEAMRLAESRHDVRYPPIGACLLAFITDGEMDVYKDYADSFEFARSTLDSLCDDPAVIAGFEAAGFGVAVRYVLPELLLEPVLHMRHYFELLDLLIRITPPDGEGRIEPDVGRLRQAISALSYIERSVSVERIPLLAVHRSFNRMAHYMTCRQHGRFGRVQSNIGEWRGSDIAAQVTKTLKSATDIRIWHEKAKKTAIRKVWIFDSMAIFCKIADKKAYQYRLKERFDSRHTQVTKINDTSDYKNAIRLEQSTHGDEETIVLTTDSPAERDELYGVLMYAKTTRFLEQQLQKKVQEYERDLPSLMPDAAVYKFSEPDSTRNIRFEDGDGPSEVVKGATVLKLVERLTFPGHADMTYVQQFLISFRSFCTPKELLGNLVDRYRVPEPNLQDKNKVRLFNRKIAGPIRLRVVNVLKQWIDKHYSDFKTDATLLKQLLQFIKGDLSTDLTMKSKVALLTKSIRRQRELSEKTKETLADPKNPAPVVLWPMFPSDTLHILTLHPVEVARQLTKIESELYRSIKPSELTGQGWTKADKHARAPNVLNMINRFNQVSNWVTRTVLECKNFAERVECVSLFLEILREMRNLQNFNGVMEIVAGLQISSIERLKLTWAEISPKRMQIMEKCAALVNPTKNFAALRQEISQLHPPCVPFFGMYLTQILHVEEGSSDFLPLNPTTGAMDKGTLLSELVNFGKRRLVAKIILEIQQYQNEPFNLNDEPQIRLFLLDFKPLNPAMAFPPPDSGKADTEAYVEKVYNLSKALEPRGTQDKSDLESHPPFFADSAKGRKDLMNKISKSSSQTMRARSNSNAGSSVSRTYSNSAASSGLVRTYSSSSERSSLGSGSGSISQARPPTRQISNLNSSRRVSEEPEGTGTPPPRPPRKSLSDGPGAGGDGDTPPPRPPRSSTMS